MGRQFGFIMDENDEKAFFDFVKQHNCFYLTDHSYGSREINEFPLEKWSSLYIYNKQFGDLVFKKYYGKYWIDNSYSPVIEFLHTWVMDNEQRITRGRLWVEMKFWNENEELVQKDSQLEALYKQCVRWIKKNLNVVVVSPYGKPEKQYVSKSLEEKVISGYRLF